jgi:hypothetical protein
MRLIFAEKKKAVAAATALEILLRGSVLRRIEAKLRSSAFRVGFGLAPALLIRRFKCSQPADFLENSLSIELVLQALERPVDWLTFTNNYFWHGSFLASKICRFYR